MSTDDGIATLSCFSELSWLVYLFPVSTALRALLLAAENHARDGGICTHTSLTGRPHPGAYTILLEERNEFLNLYHKALVHQQTEGLYLTERTGDLFRFFVDLDGDQAVIMHIAEVFDDHFWKVMRRIFDDIVYEELGDFPSTVSITELHKVHINYKGAVTFAEEACRLVDLAKQRLVEAYRNEGGTGLADEMMDKIFDKSVS